MNLARPHSYSAYMEFAKLQSPAKYNLATSGVKNCSLVELGLSGEDLAELEIHGPTIYGYAPLREAIGRMKGVQPECVVQATGTSMANHLAMSALFAPGDEVLIEEPTYGLILSTALYLGAKVRRFARRAEDNYALDLDAIGRQVTTKTRLIVLTNMHNPSSALAGEASLRGVGELALRVGARVLVDEVYLEALQGEALQGEALQGEALHRPRVPSAIHLGAQFVVTSSLTKAYGLSGLRCGWILAEPALARSMWRLDDLFSSTPVHLAELLSVLAIERLEGLSRRAEALIEPNRLALREMLGSHPAIELDVPAVGTTAFPRLRSGESAEFCKVLRERYETSVVPGSYFERPDHFRIGLAGDVEMTREGLARVAEALHGWHGARSSQAETMAAS